jgi:chromosome partitioning protein
VAIKNSWGKRFPQGQRAQVLLSKPMAKIFAFVNQSGGVGKTSLVVNTGYHIADHGHRVLLIDMDSQASLTKYFSLEPRELDKTVFDAIIDGSPLPIHKDHFGMDLVPANKNLVGVDSQLAGVQGREYRLKEAIEKVGSDYDYVLIDCPPSLGLLSVMSLIAANYVLIPIKTNEKGLEGADDLRETISVVLQRGNPRLQIAGAVPTMYDSRKIHDRRTLEVIEELFGKYTLHPAIPTATDFDNAWRAREPLAVFYPKHPVIERLEKIARNLENM